MRKDFVMTAKEYLGQYRSLKTDIDCKTEQLKELRELAESVSHSSSTCGSCGASDKVGKTVAKIIDQENEIRCKIYEFLELKKEIESTISKVEDPLLRQLLILKYINGREWVHIADSMNYGIRQVFRLHGKALLKIKDVIECQSQSVL